MECLTCSVKEAAKILGVSQDYIRQMDGKTLPRLTKLKGTIRFALKDVLACADETEAAIRPSELKRLKMELESAQNIRSQVPGLFVIPVSPLTQIWPWVYVSPVSPALQLRSRHLYT